MRLVRLAAFFVNKYAVDPSNTVPLHLYRGMKESDLSRLLSSGRFEKTKHNGNVASLDLETAEHWAGQRGDEDDPGLVLHFIAPVGTVAEDSIYKGDFRFVKDFVPEQPKVIKRRIFGPIKMAANSEEAPDTLRDLGDEEDEAVETQREPNLIQQVQQQAKMDNADISLGAPIHPEKVRILKDKLILVYDKLMNGITKLPVFEELNEEFSDNPYLIEFNRLIINFTNYIENNDLKHIFNYSILLIEKLKELSNSIVSSGATKEETIKFDAAVRSIQQTIWEESKRILNLHDLRGIKLHFPELSGILNESPKPTWDFAGPKSPVQPKIRQNFYRVHNLIKRLEQENRDEEQAKRKRK